MSDLGWVPEPHPIPLEILPTFHAAPFTPEPVREWATFGERLDTATKEMLLMMAKGVL